MFTVKYDPACECNGKMEDTIVEYGKNTRLRSNIFSREGYTFVGWDANRISDDSHCYVNSKTGERRYFKEGKNGKEYVRHYYSDQCFVSKLSRVENDIIIMRAVWKQDMIQKNVRRAEENKDAVRNKILNSNVVLIGEAKCIEEFYMRYCSMLDVRKMIITESLVGGVNSCLNMQIYKDGMVCKSEFYILCAKVKTRGDSVYKRVKTIMDRNNLHITENYIRSDMADAILDQKRIFMWYGYCQVQVLGMQIFSKVLENAACFYFRYDLDTLCNSYKYMDGIELLKLCDYLIYVPIMFDDGKIDYNFDEYLPLECIKLRIPRMPFMGLYPYRTSSFEAFYKYSVDKKLHWPFAYEESIIDRYILDGKDNEYIYSELMRHDLIDKKVIEKQLKFSFKSIEIAESQADIKILDYIKNNFRERKCYRDGLHYENFIYFELARRISNKLELNCLDHINKLEENQSSEIIDYTEVPILQCVADVLGVKWVNDATTYRVRFTEKGEWRGKASIKIVNRKEWINMYCDYTRANITLLKMWNLF